MSGLTLYVTILYLHTQGMGPMVEDRRKHEAVCDAADRLVKVWMSYKPVTPLLHPQQHRVQRSLASSKPCLYDLFGAAPSLLSVTGGASMLRAHVRACSAQCTRERSSVRGVGVVSGSQCGEHSTHVLGNVHGPLGRQCLERRGCDVQGALLCVTNGQLSHGIHGTCLGKLSYSRKPFHAQGRAHTV